MLLIKKKVKALISTRFGWRIVDHYIRENGVTVLMYHRINGSDETFPGLHENLFWAQMKWLKRNCHPIWPEKLKEAATKRSSAKTPILVTFDDGYRDYYERALPILADLKIPAIVFVATSFMDNQRMIWTDIVTWAIHVSRKKTLTLPWNPDTRLDLMSAAGRGLAGERIKAALKDLPNSQRENYLEDLLKALDVEEDLIPEKQMMNWEEVRQTLEWTRIGGHSHTHPILSKLDEYRLDEEIRVCKERIMSEVGVAPKYFAYPNGRRTDFNDNVIDVLKQHGFEMGFATVGGLADDKTDWWAIRRQPTHVFDLGSFASLVAGIYIRP